MIFDLETGYDIQSLFWCEFIIEEKRMEMIYNTVGRIHVQDGYQSDPVWTMENNYSTYYNYSIDKQCKIPGRSLEKI